MRIVSYNILCPELAVKWSIPQGITYYATSNGKPISNWGFRKHQVIGNFKNAKAHVFCLQECTKDTIKDISTVFEKAVYSENKPKPMGVVHGVAIFFDPTKVKCIAAKVFKSLNNDNCYRGEAYADFRENESDLKYRVSSFHLVGYDYDEKNVEKLNAIKQVGLKQIKEITQKLESEDIKDIDYLVLCGDFNEDANEIGTDNSRVKFLLDKGYLYDKNLTGTEVKTGRKIDWIFYKPLTEKAKEYIGTHVSEDIINQYKEASDHYMTATEFSKPARERPELNIIEK